MKTNLFNTTGEYNSPECKTVEIVLEGTMLQTGSNTTNDEVQDKGDWGSIDKWGRN